MQNVLKDSGLVKVYINYYTDKKIRKKIQVNVRYMDFKSCYFVSSVPPLFEKPKHKSIIDITAYTSDGVYTSQVKSLGVDVTLYEVLFETTIPQNWKFIQLRKGTRKEVALPLSIKFDDGFEITATTFDLSVGGVSFDSYDNISTLYQRLNGELTLQLPNNLYMNFPDGKMICNSQFVRVKENKLDGTKRWVFKFTNLTSDEIMILQNYLLKIDS
ncbi:MAG: PilZ domain-containing protein [bacterium]|nr:PilZ domain-containing protein [bacterium]